MKQRITIEQLNEIPRESKHSLTKRWKPQEGDLYAYINNFTGKAEEEIHIVSADANDDEGGWEELEEGSNDYVYKYSGKEQYRYETVPLLSIGQMIELLSDFYNKHNGKVFNDETEEELKEFSVEFAADGCWRITGDLKIGEKEELCDALWEACKEVLAKE